MYWKHRELFSKLIILLGGFQLLMMLFGVSGARFGEALIRELAIQSEVVAEGSIDRVMSGKHYNRAMRLHKITYEAFMRLLVQALESFLSSESAVMLEEQKQVEQLKEDFCQRKCEEVLNWPEYSTWFRHFEQFVSNLKEKGSDLAKFWLSYLELCELALNLIFATRSGNWELYLSCVEEVLPWHSLMTIRITRGT